MIEVEELHNLTFKFLNKSHNIEEISTRREGFPNISDADLEKMKNKRDELGNRIVEVINHAPKGYKPLQSVLAEALDQASRGKGKERHADGKPFLEQPIMDLGF